MSNKILKLTEEALEATGILSTKVRYTTEYTKNIRSKADKIEDIQFLSSSSDSLTKMMAETAKDVKFDRTGVTFVPARLQHLASTIKVTGIVRKLTFTPKERPSHIKNGPYNSVIIEPAEFPQVPDTNGRLTGEDKDTIFLQLNSSTASSDVTVTDTVITNTPPYPPPPDTGCRIQAARRVMASRPLVVRGDQKVMFHTRVSGSIKMDIGDNIFVFETAVTSSPVDCNMGQRSGLSVRLVTCLKHKSKICLYIFYDSSVIAHVPMFINNRVGESFDVSLFHVLDGNTNRIDVIDPRNNQTLGSAMNAVFGKPLWVMMYVYLPCGSDMKAELLSGNKAYLSERK